MSVLQKLTEGIVNRDLKKEGAALLSKWNSTGLLEGLGNESTKHTMARLLENQAKELLREASTMSGGDVEGFAAVAFPIVRRVFGGLVANQLVSVQPMSLPSGLIFFMDFTFDDRGPTRLSAVANASLYGGGKVGQQITGGVDLSGVNAEKSFYSLNNGYSSPTGSTTSSDGATVHTFVASGTWDGSSAVFDSNSSAPAGGLLTVAKANQVLQWDLGLVSGAATTAGAKTADGGTSFCIAEINLTGAIGDLDQFNFDDLVSLVATNGTSPGTYSASVTQARRLTQFSGTTGPNSGRNDTNKTVYVVGLSTTTVGSAIQTAMGAEGTYSYPITDNFGGTPAAGASSAIGAVVGDDAWGLENNQNIPEIDLKVDSVSVTAITKKLKAKWTPELGQDLNAYHNLDAEVELTSILSEQIALEIDQEILEDLVKGATASTYYWSRSPGLFVNRETGAEVGASAKAPDFTGTVSEWYETLIETVNDVSAQIHRKTLRGGANFIVTSPEVANILEFTAGFRASVTADDNKGIAGAEKVGSISKKFEVYVDPYFVRNLLLVGRKGNSFLESGYVYAPYVPLQVTPTIFGVEDFVPRKGVMTRYAKKMVRPDMYGLVVVRGLLGESGT